MTRRPTALAPSMHVYARRKEMAPAISVPSTSSDPCPAIRRASGRGAFASCPGRFAAKIPAVDACGSSPAEQALERRRPTVPQTHRWPHHRVALASCRRVLRLLPATVGSRSRTSRRKRSEKCRGPRIPAFAHTSRHTASPRQCLGCKWSGTAQRTFPQVATPNHGGHLPSRSSNYPDPKCTWLCRNRNPCTTLHA